MGATSLITRTQQSAAACGRLFAWLFPGERLGETKPKLHCTPGCSELFDVIWVGVAIGVCPAAMRNRRPPRACVIPSVEAQFKTTVLRVADPQAACSMDVVSSAHCDGLLHTALYAHTTLLAPRGGVQLYSCMLEPLCHPLQRVTGVYSCKRPWLAPVQHALLHRTRNTRASLEVMPHCRHCSSMCCLGQSGCEGSQGRPWYSQSCLRQ